jgi:hypothetical protein
MCKRKMNPTAFLLSRVLPGQEQQRERERERKGSNGR